MNIDLAEYNIELETDPEATSVCKPYQNRILADRIRKINDFISDINFVPFYSNDKLSAMLWYAETNFLGTILEKDIKGIRIRQGNILIGDENTLRKCYKEESLIAGWLENCWSLMKTLFIIQGAMIMKRTVPVRVTWSVYGLGDESSKQIRHKSYERSLAQSDKKFLDDESATDVESVDIAFNTELESYDMDDSDSVANTDLLNKLSLLMDMGKKKTKYQCLEFKTVNLL